MACCCSCFFIKCATEEWRCLCFGDAVETQCQSVFVHRELLETLFLSSLKFVSHFHHSGDTHTPTFTLSLSLNLPHSLSPAHCLSPPPPSFSHNHAHIFVSHSNAGLDIPDELMDEYLMVMNSKKGVSGSKLSSEWDIPAEKLSSHRGARARERKSVCVSVPSSCCVGSVSIPSLPGNRYLKHVFLLRIRVKV